MTSCQAGDVPVNRVDIGISTRNDLLVESVGEDHLQSIHQQFLASPGRCRVYEHVGALLVHVYQTLYSKMPFRISLYEMYDDFLGDAAHLFFICCYIIFLLYSLFQFASAPVALVLFWAAQKGHQDQLQTSPADIISPCPTYC